VVPKVENRAHKAHQEGPYQGYEGQVPSESLGLLGKKANDDTGQGQNKDA